MPNKLFIRPHSVPLEEDASFEWALYDIAGNKVGQNSNSDLDALLQTLMQNGVEQIDVIAFWPANASYSTAVELPGNQTRYLAQALPFAVEEQLAQELGSVHLAAGDKDKDFGYPVVCVDKLSFAQLFDYLGEVDAFVLKSICLDADALPVGDNDLVIALGDENALVHSRRNFSIGLSRRNLIPYLDSIFLGTAEDKPTEQETFAIKIYVEDDQAEEAKMLIAEIEQYPSVAVDLETISISQFELLCESAIRQLKPPVNLCQGDFRLVSGSGSEWRRWRGVAAILLLGFLLQLGVFVGKGYYYDQQAQSVAQQAVKEYQSVVPGSKNVSPDKLARIIKGKLNQRSQGGAADVGFLELLGEAGYQFSRSQNKQNFKFSSINYNSQRGELVIELRANNFDQLDRLKNAIVEAGLTAKISSAVQEQGFFRGRISVSGT